MGTLEQLSAGEYFDDFTGQPLGEGFIMLNTSAGNRVCFRTPAEANAYVLANATQMPHPTYNDESQTPT